MARNSENNNSRAKNNAQSQTNYRAKSSNSNNSRNKDNTSSAKGNWR